MSVEPQSPRPASLPVVRPPVTHMASGVDQPQSFEQSSLHRIRLQESNVGAEEGSFVHMISQQVDGQASRMICLTASAPQQSATVKAEQSVLFRSSGQRCVGSEVTGEAVGTEKLGNVDGSTVGAKVGEAVGTEKLGNVDGSTVGAGVGVDDSATVGAVGADVDTTATVGTEVGVGVVCASGVSAGSKVVVVASGGGGGGDGGDGADDALLSAQMPQVTGHCIVMFGM